MPQLAHIEVGDTPTDVTDGLDDGTYIAQAVGSDVAVVALYASGTAAPTDDLDYFSLKGGAFFVFTVGGDAPATWAKSATPDLASYLSLALVP